MKKVEPREVENEEILKYFNGGMSKDMLANYVSGITGLKKKEATAMVERATYKDWMKIKQGNRAVTYLEATEKDKEVFE